MTNELQQTLDNILNDKNTNLKPENLKQGVTCLGVEGAAEVPTPIYATTDYTVKNLPNAENLDISFVYKLDMYYLVLLSSSSKSLFYLYKLENNDFVFLGDTGIQGRF